MLALIEKAIYEAEKATGEEISGHSDVPNRRRADVTADIDTTCLLYTSSRIRYLERMLKTASVISDESKMDEVGLNNRVTVYFEDDDEEEVYKLVTSVRGNSLKNYISIESPIGNCLLYTSRCV